MNPVLIVHGVFAIILLWMIIRYGYFRVVPILKEDGSRVNSYTFGIDRSYAFQLILCWLAFALSNLFF